MWLIKHGEHLEYFEALAEANPDNPPEPLLNRPEVDPVTQEWVDTFNTLSAGRPWTMGGPLPITTTDILTFWQFHPIGEPLEFLAMIRQLDVVWLQHAHTKANKKK